MALITKRKRIVTIPDEIRKAPSYAFYWSNFRIDRIRRLLISLEHLPAVGKFPRDFFFIRLRDHHFFSSKNIVPYKTKHYTPSFPLESFKDFLFNEIKVYLYR